MNWCVVRLGSKMKLRQMMILKRHDDQSTSSNSQNYSTFNSEQLGGPMSEILINMS